MLGEERRNYIMNIIAKTGSIKANDIAKTLGLSEITIRRDLEKLDEKGLIKRTHGGAINIYFDGNGRKHGMQKEELTDEKKRIAFSASSLIEEDSVILIEAGITGYYIALNITNKKNLTIITNSCDIAAMLGDTNPDYKIILSGGVLSPLTRSLSGPIADSTFRSTFVDKAFLEIGGIDINKGITAADPIEAQTKRYMINSAKNIIALSDHSKVGRIAMNFVAPVKVINTLITDGETEKEFIDKLQEMEIDSIVV